MPSFSNTRIKTISNDVFFIKCAEDKYIVSLPLRGLAFYSNQEGVNQLQKVLAGNCSNISDELVDRINYILNAPVRSVPTLKEKSLFGPSISIILHQLCNFECSYCFAHNARGKEALSRNDVKFIIDSWLYSSAEHKKVTFIGGGEPSLSWELLRWSIDYIRGLINNEDVKIVLVTNGSLLNHEKVNYLKSKSITVSLSFDILPDIQDSQRPFYNSTKSSFAAVDSFLKDAEQSHLNCEIRCTITPRIVHRMSEMVMFVSRNYPEVEKIHFEHVTSSSNPHDFYSSFTREFFTARALGRNLGITVYNSITSSQGKVRFSFCGGTSCFVPTPEGDILCSACHRISSHKDKLMDTFNDAVIHNHHIFVNKDAPHKSIRGMLESCVRCPAKWQCAGGCLMERLTIGNELFKLKCEMVRDFNRLLLEEQLNT